METTESSPPPCPVIPAVRHKERRRTATCAFGNRVATVSVQHYRRIVTTPPPATCVATVVCHDAFTDTLTVLAMGVGTKFMMDDDVSRRVPYGTCVRDCHAEVLARRAWRRYLTNAIQRLESNDENEIQSLLLEKQMHCTPTSPMYRLRPGFTLHFYCSSAPCGNAVIKKFATFSKEVYNPDIPSHTWPKAQHPDIGAHSVPLGQLALLVKQKPSPPPSATGDGTTTSSAAARPSRPLRYSLTRKQSTWPIYTSVAWCPPGTTPVWNIPHQASSSHTCSDKLARWHVLGWQGSLLHPWTDRLAPATLTIGRKFAAVTAARALCCRVAVRNKMMSQHEHPTLLGTNVYLDDGAQTVTDEPQRFHDSKAWVSWYNDQSNTKVDDPTTDHSHTVECIDAYTGLLADAGTPSEVSTVRLVHDLQRSDHDWETLQQLRARKRSISPVYEQQKDDLLSSEHPVFRDWCRREHEYDEEQQPRMAAPVVD